MICTFAAAHCISYSNTDVRLRIENIGFYIGRYSSLYWIHKEKIFLFCMLYIFYSALIKLFCNLHSFASSLLFLFSSESPTLASWGPIHVHGSWLRWIWDILPRQASLWARGRKWAGCRRRFGGLTAACRTQPQSMTSGREMSPKWSLWCPWNISLHTVNTLKIESNLGRDP